MVSPHCSSPLFSPPLLACAAWDIVVPQVPSPAVPPCNIYAPLFDLTMSWMPAGAPDGNTVALLKRLELCDAEAKKLSAELRTARKAVLAKPGEVGLLRVLDGLQANEARLVKRRADLETSLFAGEHHAAAVQLVQPECCELLRASCPPPPRRLRRLAAHASVHAPTHTRYL